MIDKVKVATRMRKYMKTYQKTNERYRVSHKKCVQKYLKTVKGQASKLVTAAKFRAKEAELEFTINQQWCIEKLESGYCERTGIPFDKEKSKYAPSIDRIDRTKGYTPENSQLVVWIYNTCKNKYSDSDVLEFAKRLIEHASCKVESATR